MLQTRLSTYLIFYKSVCDTYGRWQTKHRFQMKCRDDDWELAFIQKWLKHIHFLHMIPDDVDAGGVIIICLSLRQS